MDEDACSSNFDPLPINFTDLPQLVTISILETLDKSTLLALRLTCHTTKLHVDTLTPLLSHFSLTLPKSQSMTELTNYFAVFPSKWQCISFPTNDFTSFDSFPSFVSFYSPHITTLHLHHFDGSLSQILFLSSCEALCILRIDEMDLRKNPTLVVASDTMLKAKCPKLLDIFTGLTQLTIGIIYFNDQKQLCFYQTFLQRCKTLSHVNIPRPQGPPSISWEGLKQVQLKWLIGPVHEYLRKKPLTKPIKSDIEILDVGGLFSKHFPAVAEACVQIGAPTKFSNVSEKQVKYLFTHEATVLGRIVSLSEKIDDRRPLDLWLELRNLYVKSSRCDIRKVYQVGFTSYPKLEELTLVLDSRSRDDPNFEMLKRLVDCLVVGRERTNLRKLWLQWPVYSNDTPKDFIKAKDFAGGCTMLTKLRISGWTGGTSDFLLIWAKLTKLKEVILEDCQCLTDEGIMGHEGDLDSNGILNLKELTFLEVKFRNVKGFLTDKSFIEAFSKMRLVGFLVESFQVSTKGYESLAAGQFAQTIRKLQKPLVLPHGMFSDEDFYTFVAKYFPNVVASQ